MLLGENCKWPLTLFFSLCMGRCLEIFWHPFLFLFSPDERTALLLVIHFFVVLTDNNQYGDLSRKALTEPYTEVMK